MILATDALSDEKAPLITQGTELTAVHRERWRNFADIGGVIQPVSIRPKPPENANAAPKSATVPAGSVPAEAHAG